MSSSQYHFFGINGGAPIATIVRGNGFGSHPVIWKYLCKKYLDSDCWLLTVEQFWKEPEKILHRMTPDDRFLLRVTYDGFLIRREDFLRLSGILRRLLADGPYNHWTFGIDDKLCICSVLENLSENPAILGMGVYATSVSDDPWRTCPPQDEDGNELEGEYGWVDARTAPVASDEET